MRRRMMFESSTIISLSDRLPFIGLPLVRSCASRQLAQATAVLAASAAGSTILKRVNLPGWVLTPILPPSA